MSDAVIYRSSKELLLDIPVPAQTRSHKPVAYRRLIDTTLEGISREGFTLNKEQYLQAQGGNQATGRYELRYGNDPDMGLMLVWQSSYNKSISLKIAVGAVVFVCSNGACFGDVGAYKKKHVGAIQTLAPQTISEYLRQAGDNFEEKIRMKTRMKEIEVSKRTSAELIGRLYIEESIINSTQLNIIKRQIETPEFDYQAAGSLWELYQHGTRSIRDAHPADWLRKHIDIDTFFIREFNLQNA